MGVKSFKGAAALIIFLSCWVAQGQTPPSAGEMGTTVEGSSAAEASGEDLLQDSTTSLNSIRKYLAPFKYDATVLRDPFRPPEIPIPLQKGEMYGPFLPLQAYRVEDLILKGLIWNVKKPKAIVATPDGKTTYRVGLKDYIGENFGYVASIREKELVIVQTIEDDGHRYSTTKVMFFNNQRSVR